MIDLLSATQAELEDHVDGILSNALGPGLVRDGPSWRLESEEAQIHVFLERRAVGADKPPEPVLELLRSLRDLGHHGDLGPEEAMDALESGAAYRFCRITVGAHPSGNRHIGLLLAATLHLADLQHEELIAVLDELRTAPQNRARLA